MLTHLPLVPHLCVNELRQWTVQSQAITWANAVLLSIRPLGTNFSIIKIKIQNFSLMKMHLKMSSVKWRPNCPGGDELILMLVSRDSWHGFWFASCCVTYQSKSGLAPGFTSQGNAFYDGVWTKLYLYSHCLWHHKIINTCTIVC